MTVQHAEPETTTPPVTVLVVEDEPGLRTPLVRALRRQGYAVLEAEHGGDALARSEAHAGPIELLLTDVMMPVMNGTELARQLRERRPALRVLFMSGYSDQAIDATTLEPGRTAFLEKPFPTARLVRAVKNLLAGE